MSSTVEPETMAAVFLLASGTSVGVSRWLILRQHVRNGGWWVLASIVGWVGLGPIVGKSLDRFTDLIAIAALPPAITGIALVWPMHQSRPVMLNLGHKIT
jgi:hypothetical protein